MIKFNYQTTVKEYKKIKFPRQMFRLKSFEYVKSKGVNDKMLIGMYNTLFVYYYYFFDSDHMLSLIN